MDFKLVRAAKAKGGDRYEHGSEGDSDWMVVYIPQSISRGEHGRPAETFVINFERGE